MTKTIRMHEINTAAEKKFGPKLRELKATVRMLSDRLRAVESAVNTVPVPMNSKKLEAGSTLNKDKSSY